jgi:hypothetical protein
MLECWQVSKVPGDKQLCLTATFYYTNPTWSGLGLNLDSCCPADGVARPKPRLVSRLSSSCCSIQNICCSLYPPATVPVLFTQPAIFRASFTHYWTIIIIIIIIIEETHADTRTTISHSPLRALQFSCYNSNDSTHTVLWVTQHHNTPAAIGPSSGSTQLYSTVAWWAETYSRWSVVTLWL